MFLVDLARNIVSFSGWGKEIPTGKYVSDIGGTFISSLMSLELDCLDLNSGSIITRNVTLDKLLNLSCAWVSSSV